MTFQRSLYISLFIHALVFGTALAFAQLAKGTLWGHQNVIVVSLDGSGPGTQGRVSQVRVHREVSSDRRPDAAQGVASSLAQPEISAQMQTGRENALISGDQENKTDGTGNTGGAGVPNGQAGEDTAGQDSGAQSGVVPAEQWAIIVSSIERSKAYPRVARERGIQGVVHVRFRIRPSGDIETVQIVKSSGYDILDTASIKTVYRAAPMPYVNGWVEVPMAYIIK